MSCHLSGCLLRYLHESSGIGSEAKPHQRECDGQDSLMVHRPIEMVCVNNMHEHCHKPQHVSTGTSWVLAPPTCKRVGSPPSLADPLPHSPPLCTQSHTCATKGERGHSRSPAPSRHTLTHLPPLTPQVALAPAHKYAKPPELLPHPPRPSEAMLK